MKPWYKSKKLWTGLATLVTTTGAYLGGEADLSLLVAAIGSVVVVAIGLADFGKEAAAAKSDPPLLLWPEDGADAEDDQ